MKKIAKKIAGAIIIAGGLGAVGLGLYSAWQGQLLALTLVLMGVGLIIAGWSLVSNKKISEFFENISSTLGF